MARQPVPQLRYLVQGRREVELVEVSGSHGDQTRKAADAQESRGFF
jgi:hypothetical protein